MAGRKRLRFVGRLKKIGEKAVEKIKELALAGDQKLLMYWGDKIIPTLRAVDLPGTVPSFAEAKTLSDKSGAILHQTSDAPSFEVYVHRSFADYAWRWLEDAGLEYGVAIAGG